MEHFCENQRHLPPALTQSDLFEYSEPRPIDELADVRSPETPLEDAPLEVEGVEGADPVDGVPVVDPSL
jgi:hypothetical protein